MNQKVLRMGWLAQVLGAMVLTVVTYWVLPEAAFARTDAEVEAAVKEVLMNRHPTDTAAWWRGLGENAPPVIIRIYESDKSMYHRMRMLEGLSAFTDDQAAVDFVKSKISDARESVLRNAGLRALGRNQGARQEEFLAGFLKHEDPHTRVTAAQALAASGSASARARVEQFKGVEKTPWVVAQVNGKEPAAGTLVESGSSEARLSREFEGKWSGYWVAPSVGGVAKDAAAMKSEPVSAELKADGATGLSGTLTIKGEVDVRYRLSGAQGKGLKWSGAFTKESPRMVTPGRPNEFKVEADLAAAVGGWTLVMRSSADGGVLVLRRVSR